MAYLRSLSAFKIKSSISPADIPVMRRKYQISGIDEDKDIPLRWSLGPRPMDTDLNIRTVKHLSKMIVLKSSIHNVPKTETSQAEDVESKDKGSEEVEEV